MNVFLVPLVIVFVMRNAKQDNHGPRSSHSRFLKTQNVLNASDLMFAKKRHSKDDQMVPTKPNVSTDIYVLLHNQSIQTLNSSLVSLVINSPLGHPTFTFIKVE